jgi:tRNA-specific 2-thiouridylase
VTIGQRRGLGVALGEPRYVVDVDPDTQTVVLGRQQDLAVRGINIAHPTWVHGPVPDGGVVEAQYRAHGDPVVGRLVGDTVEFEKAQYAVAPGQTIAFYNGDEVVGSAAIARTRNQCLSK